MEYRLLTSFLLTQEIKDFYGAKKTKMRWIEGPEGTIMKKFDNTETTFLNEFVIAWNNKRINTAPGTYKLFLDAYIDMFENTELFPPKPTEFDYTVKTRHYLKFFTPTDYRGIRNYVTEKFKPSFIKMEGVIPFSDDKTWQFIEDPAKLSLNSIRLEVDIVDIEKNRFIRTEWKE